MDSYFRKALDLCAPASVEILILPFMEVPIFAAISRAASYSIELGTGIPRCAGNNNA